MLKMPDFTRIEIDYIKQYGNLTPREEKVLELRNQQYPPTIEQMAEIMGTTPSTVNRAIKSLKKKIIRLL